MLYVPLLFAFFVILVSLFALLSFRVYVPSVFFVTFPVFTMLNSFISYIVNPAFASGAVCVADKNLK